MLVFVPGWDIALAGANWRYSGKLLWRKTGQLKTLTGRTVLWDEIRANCHGTYLLGLGYGAYWTSERFEATYKKTGWRFTDSHSAYLETMTGTGLMGVGLYFLLCTLSLVSSTATPESYMGFRGAFFAAVMVHSFFESSFVLPNYFSFLFFLMVGNNPWF
jgi:O-antigen ligase